MNFLRNLKIRTKLIGGFTIMILLLLLTGFIGHRNTSHVFGDLRKIFSTELPRLDYLIEADRDLQQLLVAERSLIFADANSQKFSSLLGDYEKNLQQTKERMGKFRDLSSHPKDLQLYSGFETALKQWEPVSREIVDARKSGQENVADLSLGEANDKFEQMRDFIDKLTESVLTEANESEQSASGVYASAGFSILITLIVAVIVGVFIVWLITSSINRPLAKTILMLKELSSGHIDQRANLKSNDEIGQMGKALDEFADSLQREMVDPLQQLANCDLTFRVTPRDSNDRVRGALKKAGDDLNTIVGQMQISGEQITSASSQVAASSQTLSQSATETAASLEEISSSISEMAAQTKHSAENANLANQLAAEASKAAGNGGRQMQAMISAMSEISEAGQSIGKIIKTIDEIAFQTNLLALNAAVEAARAGQHGKGFAVVAEEVRNLAARSAKAANETAELIEGTVKKTQNGSQIAEQTSTALSEIVTSITKVTDLVAEIAASNSEQAQGISQINQGLGQIDQGVQQNTATAEESAAAAEELRSQASQLRQMLTRFKLSAGKSFGTAMLSMSSPMTNNMGPQKRKSSGAIGWEQSPGRKASVSIQLDDDEFGKY